MRRLIVATPKGLAAIGLCPPDAPLEAQVTRWPSASHRSDAAFIPTSLMISLTFDFTTTSLGAILFSLVTIGLLITWWSLLSYADLPSPLPVPPADSSLPPGACERSGRCQEPRECVTACSGRQMQTTDYKTALRKRDRFGISSWKSDLQSGMMPSSLVGMQNLKMSCYTA